MNHSESKYSVQDSLLTLCIRCLTKAVHVVEVIMTDNMFQAAMTPPQPGSILVLVGGWPDSADSSSYSPVSSGPPCQPRLPPLPRPYMWDLMAEVVQGLLITCNMDYNKYQADGTKDFACWSIDPEASLAAWTPLPPPPLLLFLSTSATWNDKMVVVGGSRQLHQDLDRLKGTKHLQVYHPKERSWIHGPALPGRLLEGCAVTTKELGLLVLGNFRGSKANFYQLPGLDSAWHELPSSHYRHQRPGCAVVDLEGEHGLLVVTGGLAEFFSIKKKSWRELPPLVNQLSPNCRVSVGMSSGRVVVAGGWDVQDQEKARAVEAWKEGEGWEVLDHQLEVGRTRHTEVELPAFICSKMVNRTSNINTTLD